MRMHSPPFFEMVGQPHSTCSKLQLLPLESTHLMEGQNIDSFDIPEAGNEVRDPGHVLGIVSVSRHQYEA